MAQAQLVHSEDQLAEVLAAKTRGGAEVMIQEYDIVNGKVLYDSCTKTETFDIVAIGREKILHHFVGTATNVCTHGQAPETPIKGIMKVVEGCIKPGPQAFMCRGTPDALFMTFYDGPLLLFADKWLVAQPVCGLDDGVRHLGHGQWVA